jgi:hypothetical protein
MKISPDTVAILAQHSDVQAKAIIAHDIGEQVYARNGNLTYRARPKRRETLAYHTPV